MGTLSEIYCANLSINSLQFLIGSCQAIPGIIDRSQTRIPGRETAKRVLFFIWQTIWRSANVATQKPEVYCTAPRAILFAVEVWDAVWPSRLDMEWHVEQEWAIGTAQTDSCLVKPQNDIMLALQYNLGIMYALSGIQCPTHHCKMSCATIFLNKNTINAGLILAYLGPGLTTGPYAYSVHCVYSQPLHKVNKESSAFCNIFVHLELQWVSSLPSSHSTPNSKESCHRNYSV